MPDFTVKEVEETPYLYVTRSCPMASDEIGHAMGEALGLVGQAMQRAGIAPGAPLAVYQDADPDWVTFRAGFTVPRDAMGRAGDAVAADVTPAGRALFFVHRGSYGTLRDDYDQMMEHMATHGLRTGGPSWEIYLNDPGRVPESELLTEVYAALA